MFRERLASRYRALRNFIQDNEGQERTRELTGTLLSRQVASLQHVTSLQDVEFRVHSQFGDDGIIQWLVAQLPALRTLNLYHDDYRIWQGWLNPPATLVSAAWWQRC